MTPENRSILWGVGNFLAWRGITWEDLVLADRVDWMHLRIDFWQGYYNPRRFALHWDAHHAGHSATMRAVAYGLMTSLVWEKAAFIEAGRLRESLIRLEQD